MSSELRDAQEEESCENKFLDNNSAALTKEGRRFCEEIGEGKKCEGDESVNIKEEEDKKEDNTQRVLNRVRCQNKVLTQRLHHAESVKEKLRIELKGKETDMIKHGKERQEKDTEIAVC